MAIKPSYKYITKIPLGKSKSGRPLYRYFYTREAYQAYLNGLKSQKQESMKKLNTSENKLLQPKQNRPIDKPLEPKREPVNKSVDKKFDVSAIEKILPKRESNVGVVDKITAIFNNTVESLKNTIDKGKKMIESFIDKDGDKTVEEMWKEMNNNSDQSTVQKPKNQKEEKSWLELKPGKEETIKDELDLPLKSKKTTKDEDMAATNPNFNTGEYGYTHNCASCTLAYDLRRRGYDVQAAADIDSESITSIAEWYKKYDKETGKYVTPESTKFTDLYEYGDRYKEHTVQDVTKRLEEDMLKHGDGARGHLMVQWKDGGGHDMAWEVENGKVVIYDGQINEKRTLKQIIELSDLTYSNGVQYLRTDDLEINLTHATDNIVKRNVKTSQERKERKHKRDQLNDIATNIKNAKRLF